MTHLHLVKPVAEKTINGFIIKISGRHYVSGIPSSSTALTNSRPHARFFKTEKLANEMVDKFKSHPKFKKVKVIGIIPVELIL